METANLDILAIDLGYGDVKVMTKSKRFTFTSGYAPFRPADMGIGVAYGTSVQVDGRTMGPHIVGEKAKYYPGYTEPVGDSRLGQEEILPLIAEAMVQAGDDLNGDIILSTGAPLDLYPKEKSSINRWLNKTFVLNTTNGFSRAVTIRKIITRPQGIAAAISLAAEKKLPRTPGIGVIVDIGSRTTDIVSIALEHLEPVRPLCFSIPIGVGDFFNAAAEGIGKSLQGFRPKKSLVQQLVSHTKYAHAGNTILLPPIFTQARTVTETTIANEIKTRLGEQASFVTTVIGVGGGAVESILGGVLHKILPGVTVIALSPEESVYKNAEGYYVIAAESSREAA